MSHLKPPVHVVLSADGLRVDMHDATGRHVSEWDEPADAELVCRLINQTSEGPMGDAIDRDAALRAAAEAFVTERLDAEVGR